MSKRAKVNSVRVIAGRWRGRRLPVLNSDGLRPTTDRVRETVFNWLMHDMAGAHCLDLFAGTGALGFESLSRGADHLCFVEVNRRVADQLRQNIALMDAAERSEVITTTDGHCFFGSAVSVGRDT
jgi:16S rRNA (guanine966-N2)-methyltransferase